MANTPAISDFLKAHRGPPPSATTQLAGPQRASFRPSERFCGEALPRSPPFPPLAAVYLFSLSSFSCFFLLCSANACSIANFHDRIRRIERVAGIKREEE